MTRLSWGEHGRRGWRWGGARRGAALGLTLALALSSPIAGQDSGRIMGQVTTRSGVPVSGVQVYLAGSTQGTLTGQNGRYLIPNVTAGTHQLRLERIGYAAETHEVRVTAGETVTLDIQLAEQALGLDEIVVTGTAGSARRREIGNTIAQINVAEIAAPPVNVDQLLQSRAPGVRIGQGNGSVGSGGQIRLRGNVSVSQSNQPIVYIDGIRVRNEAYARNISPTEGSGRGGNVTASPINDINPNDIDRIEIIKGSAASTLFGTEASSGVIQIFTKRGVTGAPRWTLQIDQGFNKLLPFAPDVDVRPESDITADSPRGDYSYKYMNLDPFLREGHRQKYSLGVSGGGQALQYFISGQYDGNEGVLPLDLEEKVGLRGNFTFAPLSNLNLQVNTAYNRTDLSHTPAGNNAQGLILNAFRRERNYFSQGDPDSIALILNQKNDTRIDRYILGGTVNYQATENLSGRLTVGYDAAVQDDRSLRPYAYRQEPGGKLYTGNSNFTTLTLDLVSNYRLALTQDVAATLSLGGQNVTTETRRVRAEGINFAGPGDPNIDAGSNRLGWEERVRVVNAGFFGQALFSLKDRYFLTGGLRVDGNSAFGEDLGLQAYPKVSGSYVISDEEFWSGALGTMKLRAAYGQSGRAPGTFDAVRTWLPSGYGGQPSYLPENLGNPVLGPERTAEIEVGLDWALLSNRVTTEFTWYRQRTTDALFNVRKAPSEGFALFQQENVGKIQNQGIEFNINAALIDLPRWGFDLGFNVYTNDSEVLDLGGAPPFAAGGTSSWVETGYPVPVLRGAVVRNGDRKEAPVNCASTSYVEGTACFELDVPMGPPQPTLILGVAPQFRLPHGLQLSARGEYQSGHYIYDGPSNEGINRAIRWPTCLDYYALTDAGRGDEATAERRYWCDSRYYQRGTMIRPADHFKLRDVTLQVPLGGLIPRSANSTLTVSAQNWYRWRNSDFPMFDPEMLENTGFSGAGQQNPQITEHIPPAAIFIASVRVMF